MNLRRTELAVWVVLVLALVGMVATTPAHAQAAPPDCPEAPPEPAPESVSDDATQTWLQRIEDVARCEAIVARLDQLADLEQDTRRLVGWVVGVLLVVASVPVLGRIARAGA